MFWWITLLYYIITLIIIIIIHIFYVIFFFWNILLLILIIIIMTIIPLWAAGRWSLSGTAARWPASRASPGWSHTRQSTRPEPIASQGRSRPAERRRRRRRSTLVWGQHVLSFCVSEIVKTSSPELRKSPVCFYLLLLLLFISVVQDQLGGRTQCLRAASGRYSRFIWVSLVTTSIRDVKESHVIKKYVSYISPKPLGYRYFILQPSQHYLKTPWLETWSYIRKLAKEWSETDVFKCSLNGRNPSSHGGDIDVRSPDHRRRS